MKIMIRVKEAEEDPWFLTTTGGDGRDDMLWYSVRNGSQKQSDRESKTRICI